MLARLQQFIVFILLAAFIAWVGYFVANGWATWAAVGPIAVVAAYAAAIGIEFFLLRRSYGAGDLQRPGLSALASAWRHEVLAAPAVFLWRQPFRSVAMPDSLRVSPSPRRGIVLVHGFFCNRGLWNPWLARLSTSRVPFVALSLEPLFGSIDAYVDQVEDAVHRVEVATGLRPVLVGHSMGGLAIRAWLARYDAVDRIRHVVTVGTPHRGTAMARHSHTTNGRQMRPDSAWLQALFQKEAASIPQAFTCFWSRCDNIVFPTESATLPGADNRQLDATPHVRMVYHPDVFAEVMRVLEQAGGG